MIPRRRPRHSGAAIRSSSRISPSCPRRPTGCWADVAAVDEADRMTPATEPSLKEFGDLLSALAGASPSKARGHDIQKLRVYSAIVTALTTITNGWYGKATVKLAGY